MISYFDLAYQTITASPKRVEATQTVFCQKTREWGYFAGLIAWLFGSFIRTKAEAAVKKAFSAIAALNALKDPNPNQFKSGIQKLEKDSGKPLGNEELAECWDSFQKTRTVGQQTFVKKATKIQEGKAAQNRKTLSLIQSSSPKIYKVLKETYHFSDTTILKLVATAQKKAATRDVKFLEKPLKEQVRIAINLIEGMLQARAYIFDGLDPKTLEDHIRKALDFLEKPHEFTHQQTLDILKLLGQTQFRIKSQPKLGDPLYKMIFPVNEQKYLSALQASQDEGKAIDQFHGLFKNVSRGVTSTSVNLANESSKERDLQRQGRSITIEGASFPKMDRPDLQNDLSWIPAYEKSIKERNDQIVSALTDLKAKRPECAELADFLLSTETELDVLRIIGESWIINPLSLHYMYNPEIVHRTIQSTPKGLAVTYDIQMTLTDSILKPIQTTPISAVFEFEKGADGNWLRSPLKISQEHVPSEMEKVADLLA